MSQHPKKVFDKDTQQYICNLLREGTIRWSGRKEALRRARKKVHDGRFTKAGKPIYKLQWQCNKCRTWVLDEKAVEVDHIEEVGPYKGDLHEYASRMYCDQDNLQVLCAACHMKKTVAYNSSFLNKVGGKRNVKEGPVEDLG